MFFSFKINHKNLIGQKSKKVKGAFAQFIALSLLTSDAVDSFLEVVKISDSCYQMLVMLTKVLRLFSFSVCYTYKDSQTTLYMKHVDTS